MTSPMRGRGRLNNRQLSATFDFHKFLTLNLLFKLKLISVIWDYVQVNAMLLVPMLLQTPAIQMV